MSIITSYGNGKAAPPRDGSVHCTARDCTGEVVRHSLGCGMAVGRCTRCFARYELGSFVARNRPAARPSAISRFLHEVVTWREED
jgi:hypothetical protein